MRNGHVDLGKGHVDLKNEHRDFEQWFGQVDARRAVHCAICSGDLKRGKKAT